MQAPSRLSVAYLASLLLLILLGMGCKNQYLVGYMVTETFAARCKWRHTLDYDYKPRFPEYVDSLRALPDSFSATIVLGTWCNDSRKWVRRFFALRQAMPLREVEIVAVDTTKRDERGYYQRYNYDSIPVFIFRREAEIGRIYVKPVRPRRSIERDIYRIVKPGGTH